MRPVILLAPVLVLIFLTVNLTNDEQQVECRSVVTDLIIGGSKSRENSDLMTSADSSLGFRSSALLSAEPKGLLLNGYGKKKKKKKKYGKKGKKSHKKKKKKKVVKKYKKIKKYKKKKKSKYSKKKKKYGKKGKKKKYKKKKGKGKYGK